MRRWIALVLWTAACTAPAADEPKDMSDASSMPDATAKLTEDMSPDVTTPVLDITPDISQELAPPAGLTRYLVGNEGDADVTPGGPAIVLMGGGPDVDEAFEWWRPKLSGGDIVVLRASGADGYNDYLYKDIGGADSVETLLVDTRALADDPWVAARVAQAEGVFLAGGDQSRYLAAWRDTALSEALAQTLGRGAVIGGTSAGCAILSEFVYAAREGTVYSDEALANPYDARVTLEGAFLPVPTLEGVITDTHFYERDRMGRLVAFVARLKADGDSGHPVGLGFDEATALVIDASGEATVMGDGYVYVVDGGAEPEQCAPGQALTYAGVPYTRLGAGAKVTLPALSGLMYERAMSAAGGELTSDEGDRIY